MTENVEKVVKEPQNPIPNMSLVCAVKQGSEFTKKFINWFVKGFLNLVNSLFANHQFPGQPCTPVFENVFANHFQTFTRPIQAF
jgi:hypothetical protein